MIPIENEMLRIHKRLIAKNSITNLNLAKATFEAIKRKKTFL